MPALHIREVDDAILQRLKLRAKTNRRSLQGEVLSILEEASLPKEKGSNARRPLRIHRVAVGAKVDYSRQEIYGEEND
jgi:plasmid stability protein